MVYVFKNSRGNGKCPIGIGSGQHDYKLLPAVAGHDIARTANHLLQGMSYTPQAAIAGLVSVGIVEAFEKSMSIMRRDSV